jgi:hypothetical protein
MLDPLAEEIPDIFTLCFAELFFAQEKDIVFSQFLKVVLVSTGEGLFLFRNDLKYLGECFFVPGVGDRLLFLEFDHTLEGCDPHAEELIPVVGIYSEEFNAFDKRGGHIQGFLEYPLVKMQPADLTVDEIFILIQKA